MGLAAALRPKRANCGKTIRYAGDATAAAFCLRTPPRVKMCMGLAERGTADGCISICFHLPRPLASDAHYYAECSRKILGRNAPAWLIVAPGFCSSVSMPITHTPAIAAPPHLAGVHSYRHYASNLHSSVEAQGACKAERLKI